MSYTVSGRSCSAMENFFFFTGAIIGSVEREKLQTHELLYHVAETSLKQKTSNYTYKMPYKIINNTLV